MPCKFFSCLLILFLLGHTYIRAQVWVPDNGDGTYTNPVLYADYSDPDVIRVGTDYYLVASSFTCQPGIPVLHSKDLVNWTIINYVYTALPHQRYRQPQHGQGSWHRLFVITRDCFMCTSAHRRKVYLWQLLPTRLVSGACTRCNK